MSIWRRRAKANSSLTRQRLLSLQRLEDRLAPAIAIMGPHTDAELQLLADTWATSWQPHVEVPPSATGAAADLHLGGAMYFGLGIAELGNRLLDAPKETSPDAGSDTFVISVPRPDGSFQRFSIWQTSIMEPGLEAQFPEIQTYRGRGIDDPYATLVADVTDLGFHAQVLSPYGAYYIDPYYHLDSSVYAAYYKGQNYTPHSFLCTVSANMDGTTDGDSDNEAGGCNCPLCQAAAAAQAAKDAAIATAPADSGSGYSTFNASGGTTLRTYRLACAADGEYTAFFGGTVADGQAAIVTAINRVDGVYQQQLAIRLVLVANNSSLVYTDANADPYMNTSGSTMLSQNQSTCDSTIGTANYDIGHVFSTGGGGIAGLGVVGKSGSKAQGVTGSSSPVNDSFWIDYVAHEMGHQFGANHPFNSTTSNCGSNNRNAATAYEQGSGSTIMAYAGICGADNLQPHSDPYFLWKSLDEISTYTSSGFGVGNVQSATGNSIPVVTPGPTSTIPANTPFSLTGSATDADGGSLTYLWEEADLGVSTTITAPDNGSSPLFRSFPPTTSPTRVFPTLSKLLANANSVGEVMPSTNRTLNFKLTVFDSYSSSPPTPGAFATASRSLAVVDTGSAFAVTSPNIAITWIGNTFQTVTWNVAGTTANGINAANVDILLSTDGGLTFPTMLAAGVPNNGSAVIALPNNPTTTARIKVQASGNVFFDVSNSNFTITSGSNLQVTSTTPANGAAAAVPLTQLDLNFNANIKSATVGTDDLVLSQGSVVSAELLPSQTTVRYTLTGLNSDGALSVTIPINAVSDVGSNGNNQFVGNYSLDIDTGAFPTPLAPVGVLGSLAYSGTASGTIYSGSDTDAYTISLDAGQSVSVLLTSASTLRGSINVSGPGSVNQTASATAVGGSAIVQLVSVTTAGLYTLTISSLSGTSGSYTARLDVNGAIEAEGNGGGSNDSTAQVLTGLNSIGGAASLATIRGRTETGTGAISTESESNNTTATANDATGDFAAAASSQVYQLTLTGTISSSGDLDYFNIGSMQIGDVITVAMSGSDGGRGTMFDPLVRLYNSTSGSNLIEADDRVSGTSTYLDALNYRYVVTTADTYFVRGSLASGSTGTYQISVYLENADIAPTTGTGLVAEIEPNGTKGASSTVAAGNWKRVNYNSALTGAITASDSDFYKYSLKGPDVAHGIGGDVLTVIATSTSSLDVAVAFYNAGGTLLYNEKGVSDAFGANSTMYSYSIPSDGIYYVKVSASNGSTGGYSLSVDLASSFTPPSPPTAPDLFSFGAAPGKQLTLGLKGLSAGNLTLDLLDAGGATVVSAAAGSGNFDKLLTYTPSTTSNWYARVSGAANVDYQLVVDRGASQDTEPNDTIDSAQTLIGNIAVGSLNTSDDWYQFAAAKGQFLTLTTTTPGDGPGEFVNVLDPAIELYDPNNQLVASDDNSAADGRNAAMTWHALLDGNYRVHLNPAASTTGEYVLALAVSTDPPPQVSSVIIDDGTSQRSRVSSFTVNFSEAVTLPASKIDAFQLVRTYPTSDTVTLSLDETLFSSSGQTVAKLSFTGPTGLTEFGSLADGNYSLTVFASQVTDSAAQPLGGDYISAFHRLFGDADGDKTVNQADYIAFRNAFNSGPSAAFDYEGDLQVGQSDYVQFRNRFNITLP